LVCAARARAKRGRASVWRHRRRSEGVHRLLPKGYFASFPTGSALRES
jgi:hypothetical protein